MVSGDNKAIIDLAPIINPLTSGILALLLSASFIKIYDKKPPFINIFSILFKCPYIGLNPEGIYKPKLLKR
jgi:hypothetical protein